MLMNVDLIFPAVRAEKYPGSIMVLVIMVTVLFLCLMTFVALPRIARAECGLAVVTSAAELSLVQ